MIERLKAKILGAPDLAPGLPPEGLPPGVALRRGWLIPWLGGHLSGMRGSAAAVTLGRTIVVAPSVSLTARLLAHELAHVRQWEMDPWFPIRYCLATLRHGYRDNPYEVEARDREIAATRNTSGEDLE